MDQTIVRLELTVEHLRQSVQHALVAHHDDVQRVVDAEIRQYIDSGAMKAKIGESVRKHLDEAIDSAVKRAITSWARNSPTVSKAVESAVHEALWAKQSS